LRASEAAELLTITIPAVNSALQRARAAMAKHHVTDRASSPLADRQLLGVVNEFVDAIEAGDLPRVLATLTASAKWIMPPLSAWYQGRDAIATWLWQISEVTIF
jgi:hypothetical protein